MDQQERNRNIRRTTIVMVAVALTFYIGFIMVGVLQS